jgi:predicted permease
MTESVLLAVAAGTLALLVIWVLLRFVESSIADVHIVIDWRAMLFTLVIAVAAGLIFGLSPALNGTRVSLSEVLKDSAVGVVAPRLRLQSGLVVAQIALTQPMLLAMGGFILELQEDLRKVPSTTYADRVLDVRFNTNPRYGSIDQAREDTLRRLQARFAALPGVVAIVPQENADDYFQAAIHWDDRAGEELDRRLVVRVQVAPVGYFALMGIPLVRGRDFEAAHREDRTAVVIGAAAASRLWPGADPIGRRLVPISPTRRGPLFTVVGVVDDSRAGLRDAGDEIRLFLPNVSVTGHFLIRFQAPAQPMVPIIRAEALAEAPGLPIVSALTLDAVESAQRTSLTRAMAAVSGSGALALFLAAIGLYAVVALAVRQRVREIGIRTALGAGRQQVVRWFLMRGLRLSLVGMGVGLTLSVIVVRLITALQGVDPPSGIVGLAVLVASIAVTVALVATWIPARRAAAIDPIVALRLE